MFQPEFWDYSSKQHEPQWFLSNLNSSNMRLLGWYSSNESKVMLLNLLITAWALDVCVIVVCPTIQLGRESRLQPSPLPLELRLIFLKPFSSTKGMLQYYRQIYRGCRERCREKVIQRHERRRLQIMGEDILALPSQTDSFHNCENINFCALSLLVDATLIWQPGKTNVPIEVI